MTTIIINDKSAGAKKIIEYLKTLPYAKIIEGDEPNGATLRAMEEARTGKTTTYNNAKELTAKLRKLSNV